MTDTKVNDPDNDFFEALAGRKHNHPGAELLRQTLLEEEAVAGDVPARRSKALSAEEIEVRERIRATLISRGLISKPPAGDSALAREQQVPVSINTRQGQAPQSLLASVLDWLAKLTTPQMVGVAASVLFGAVVLVNQHSFEPVPVVDGALRGSQALSIAVAEPEKFGASLADRINSAGGEASLVQISDEIWVLSATAHDPDSLSKVQLLLRDAGFSTAAPPPYELQVRRRQ